jgi:hypothetical protein
MMPAAAPFPTDWPALALVHLYCDVAWPIVIAAATASAVPRRWIAPGPLAMGGVALLWLLCTGALHGLGGGAGAQALGLALQQPSGLLTAWAVVALWRRAVPGTNPAMDAGPVWPWPWALAWSLVGLLLYLDTLGYVAIGLYPAGLPIGPAASWAPMAVGVAALAAWARPAWRPIAVALALAVALHAVARLPTGNVWDALLDPLLWVGVTGVWVVALGRRGAGRMRRHGPKESDRRAG